MIFKDSKAIYLQIADKICDDVMTGTLTAGSRIPSVREYAASVEVNANTVMRTYDHLAQQGVLFNKRGIGFFISDDARDRIVETRRRSFLNDEINYFFKQLNLLDISADELVRMYADYCKNNDNK
ncbi:MAG: GntR family transcriptional regulator [Duncaniella sp.]|nr:GntR family transcriptional regulator [Duncaniella sp.]MDE6496202.1 GntR family transcriptional regulator [Duncaniella sp.]